MPALPKEGMVTVSDAQLPSSVPSGSLTPSQSDERIHLLKQLRLGLSSTYYSMAHVLGLRRLQDYFQVYSPACVL